ncbi:aminotransferase class I/II-fold pyridoxal phosphate-dependent enzyme [Orbaceae bacterium ESL0727]|nr:aminotransferase class I/II-fold pyridoxal phosphate-dependent enzyme [Orbaceae bacterium ESL0727]
MNNNFLNDYNETAHPALLTSILETANYKLAGYGLDALCDKTRGLIRDKLQAPHADIHFMPSGTITNLTAIAHMLKPYQAVIAAETGHINVHETGAIEATGHKVITVHTDDGKLTPECLKPILSFHTDEHMVQPKLVYISNTTELGTIYNKQELQSLYQFCQAHDLYLYLDGARLAMALATHVLTFPDLANYTDAFYIGGTKVGALMGEVLVFTHPTLSHDFRFTMKQKGAILAKSWIVAAQMQTLLQGDLYQKLGEQSNLMAEKLKTVFTQVGFTFANQPQSNQLFVKVPTPIATQIIAHYAVDSGYVTDHNGQIDPKLMLLRFCTSWATQPIEIDQFTQQLTTWIKSSLIK